MVFDDSHLFRNERVASFCGRVFYNVEEFNKFANDLNGKILVYVCGDAKEDELLKLDRKNVAELKVVLEWSSLNFINFILKNDASLVSVGGVPVNVHNVAVLFPQFFNEQNYFREINRAHIFQDLKLSNKPGTAFRKGIYLTPVEQTEEGLKFRLLRCSTNLNGPTDNFRKIDQVIVGKVNQVRPFFLKGSDELNHVLAQTYHNSVTEDGKQKKATIKAHSDKTKDMPKNGVMAFCTFYENYDGDTFTDANEKGWKRSDEDRYDWGYGKGVSILTRLKFQLKQEAYEL